MTLTCAPRAISAADVLDVAAIAAEDSQKYECIRMRTRVRDVHKVLPEAD